MTRQQYIKEWRAKNRERVRAYKKEYDAVNKEAKRLYGIEYRKKTKDEKAKTDREWARKNKDKRAAARAKWRAKNPEYDYSRIYPHRKKKSDRHWHLRTKYGLTLEQFEALFKAQDCRCAICGSERSEKRDQHMCVDHCHNSGRIRGILCRRCNWMIGHAKDDIAIFQSAIEYLLAGPAQQDRQMMDMLASMQPSGNGQAA